ALQAGPAEAEVVDQQIPETQIKLRGQFPDLGAGNITALQQRLPAAPVKAGDSAAHQQPISGWQLRRTGQQAHLAAPEFAIPDLPDGRHFIANLAIHHNIGAAKTQAGGKVAGRLGTLAEGFRQIDGKTIEVGFQRQYRRRTLAAQGNFQLSGQGSNTLNTPGVAAQVRGQPVATDGAIKADPGTVLVAFDGG